MNKVLKLSYLSILMLGGALQAMKADPNGLGQELINAFKKFNNEVNELEARFMGRDITVDELKEKSVKLKEQTDEKVLQLVAQGANVNIHARDVKTASALIEAINNRFSKKLILALIAQGADVNKQDNNGNTALMLVMPQNYERVSKNDVREAREITQALIGAGADLYLKNARGDTALFEVAIAHANYQEVLEEKRAISKLLVDEMLSKQGDKALVLAELRKALIVAKNPMLLPQYKDQEGIQALIKYVEAK